VAMKVRKGGEVVDVSQADVLVKTFSWEEVTFTLKQMASARDKDNLIAHPLLPLTLSYHVRLVRDGRHPAARGRSKVRR
jgi:hypothetical protein